LNNKKFKTKSKNSGLELYKKRLIALDAKIGNRLEDLLEYLGLLEDFRRTSRYYVGACPVHGGGGKSAFNIFHTGDKIVGNWRCFSHGCHEHFQPTLIGFVRGYLSKTKYGWRDKKDVDKEYPLSDTIKFIQSFLGSDDEDLSNIEIDFNLIEQKKFSSQMESVYARNEPEKSLNIPRDIVTKGLQIPAQYFVSRGFSPEVLKKYDVGLCTAPGKEMSGRAVAPIYDDDHENAIGCTGRSIWDMCPLCESYHNPSQNCPENWCKWKFCKWKHNQGFKGENYLYNYWFAKDYIPEEGYAIIVESPGNVWRLEEAGFHTSLGTFGAHLTDGQRHILDKSGALSLIVLTDPDEAGRIAAQSIRESCGNSYKIYEPRIGEGDIADNEVELIKAKLSPVIKQVKKDLGI